MNIYIYIYIYDSKSLDVVQSLYFGSKMPSSLYIIYSNFLRRCLFISSCDSEFHIHGVICMIVRHKENVLGSATHSDFHVSY